MHAEESEMAFQCADCGKKYPSRAKQDFENHCKTHSGRNTDANFWIIHNKP